MGLISDFTKEFNDIKAPKRKPLFEEEYQEIKIPKSMIPAGAMLSECYVTEKEVIVCGDPDDKCHNCDQMGCSTLSHVIHRFDKKDSYEKKFSS